MEFPKRTAEHIAESEAWKIFRQVIPSQWIVREVTERDYGIDCYLEIVWRNNQVTGDLCSIQIKGCETLEWNKEGGKLGKKTRYSGIKKSTVNYWINLPIPVFLMIAEISTGQLYFVSIKEQIRSQFSSYKDRKQATLGFSIFSECSINSPHGDMLFLAQYLKEKSFDKFSSFLTGLLIHWKEYHEFITLNQNRDFFLEVAEDRQLMLIQIYKTCEFLSQFIGLDWKVQSLYEAYNQDLETWGDPDCRMHEMTLDKILVELEPVFVDVLDGVRALVVERQKHYWMHTNELIYSICMKLHLDHLRKKF